MTCFIILFLNWLQLQQRFDFTMLCLTMSLLICCFYRRPISCRNTAISASTGVTVCYPEGSQVSVHRWSRRQLRLAAVTTRIHGYLTQNLTQICLSQQAGFWWCVGRSHLLPSRLVDKREGGLRASAVPSPAVHISMVDWISVCVCVANA